MKLGNRLGRVLCGTALALTFAIVPATWALSSAASAPQSESMSTMHSQTGPVDINTASESELRSVPGIGSVYAKRIVQNRPYSSKDQLVRKGVLPQGVYDKVKGQIVAHRMKK